MECSMRTLLGGGALLAALVCALPAPAVAEPATGPRETIDQGFTSTQPGTPTGLTFSGRYHAADDPQGNPPFMTRMTFYPPPGFRYDTGALGRCTATDAQLSAFGPDACPADSRLGTGTAEGLFLAPFDHDTVIDHFKHTVDAFNNTNEQIMLVHSEGWTVIRGRLQPDGSVEFNPTTCFPAPPAGPCADDYILQLGSTTDFPVHTSGTRSYATTPASCPADGAWSSVVRFWWKDGTEDRVVSRQPCSGP
jgi:hypothetical protein